MERARNLAARAPENRGNAFGFSHLPPFGGLPSVPVFWRMCSNLAACLSAPPKGYRKEAFWWMFRSARLPGRYPGRAMLASALLHAAWVVLLLNPESALFRFPAYRLPEAPAVEHEVLYFSKDDLLPLIAPEEAELEEPAPPAKPAPSAPKIDLGFHPVQTIVSKPPAPDNRRQTIIQPQSPGLLIPAEVRVPNIVYWRTEVLPPAPSLEEGRRELAQIDVPKLLAPPVVRPPLPEPPSVEAPSGEFPADPVLTAMLSEVPKLPVPARPPVPLPAPPGVAPAVNAGAMGNVIALSVTPAPPPPSPEIRLPPGNRAGDFSISPAGSRAVEEPGSGGSGELAEAILPPDINAGVGAGGLGGIRIPHLSISGGDPADIPPPVVVERPAALPEPPRPATTPPTGPENLRRLIASTARPALLPDVPRAQPPESEFFGPRRVYTIYLNMPNLTSGSGSWILRFAELNGGRSTEDGELSPPVALRKADPRYTPAAIRDRVEGTVTLGAQILRDGTVTNIHVVRGLDPRLDASAMAALTNWQFLPATRDGTAVDLEVLVQIPFRLPVF